MSRIGNWFNDELRKAASPERKMATHIIPLAEARDGWRLQPCGRIGRDDGRFNEGVIVRIKGGGRPVRDRLMMRSTSESPTHGVVILLVRGAQCLLQAKIEEGYCGLPEYLSVTATVQASRESLAFGDLPYAYLYGERPVAGSVVPQDGGMLYGKKNEVRIVYMNASIVPEAQERFCWATLPEIGELIRMGVVSEHLMQALGLDLIRRTMRQ